MQHNLRLRILEMELVLVLELLPELELAQALAQEFQDLDLERSLDFQSGFQLESELGWG